MGQSSSQVAPSQPPASSEVVPQLDGQMDPPPKPSRKRNRESTGAEEVVMVAKKSKRERRSSSNEKKAGRAVPQHKRGTAIRPRSKEDVDESQTTVEPVGDTIVVQSPKRDKRGDEQPQETGSIVNQAGKPGPRKKPRKANTTNTPADTIENVQVSHEQTVHPQVVIAVEKQNGNAQSAKGPDATRVEDGNVATSTRQSRPRRQYTNAQVAWDEAKRKLEESRNRHAKEKEDAAKDATPAQQEIEELPDAQVTGGAENAEDEDQVATGFEAWAKPQRKDKKDRKRKRKEAAQDSEGVKENVDPAVDSPQVHSKSPLMNTVSNPTPRRKKKKPAVPEAQSMEEEANTEDEAGPTQELLDSQLDLDEAMEATPKKKARKAKKSKKSAANVLLTESDDDAFIPETQSATHHSRVKTGAVADESDTRPHAMKQFSTEDRGTVTGKWSQEEFDLADKVFADFCKNNNISEAELRLKTTQWSTLGPFKVTLYETFPQRKIDNIRKHMQRRFSPYTKGEWSEEENQRLRDAYAKYPEQWAQIAKEVERTQQSCRDRYKNFLQYEESLDRGAWTVAEEAKLTQVVEEAIAVIQQNTKNADVRNDKEKAETCINWAEIATKMEGKRNKKRCFEKWQLLKRRGDKPRRTLSSTTTDAEDDTKRPSRKQATTERLHANMTPADIYACLLEFQDILTRIPDTDFHDDSTFWSVIAQRKLPDAVFAYTPLIRHTFFAAVKKFDCKKVRKATEYRKKVKAVLKRMRKLEKRGEVDLDLEEAFYGESRRAVPGTRPKKVADKKVSEDVVESEDEADGGDGREAAEPVVPETQEEGDGEAEDEGAAEDENENADEEEDQDAESLRSATPQISPEEFMEKCKQAGKKQHRAYLAGHGR